MLVGKGKTILEDLLAHLVDYTSYHFAREAQLMERIRYPEYRQHQLEHAELRAAARAMQDRRASGEITMTIEVMQFLTEWLSRHTATSDCRIGTYMKTRGSPLVL